MEHELLKNAAEKITMPDDMKRRIARNCKEQIAKSMEEHTMKNHSFFRKPAAVFAILAICLSLSVTTMAANGILPGHFRDITDSRGAVVGTSYEQATDEIDMDVSVSGNELTVLATFATPQAFPYREAEKLGIAAYRIVDANDNVVKEGAAESAETVNGRVTIRIQLDDIASGSYKIVVTAFVSEKKADQPLNISGYWECVFTK